jgi:hypothetical protein
MEEKKYTWKKENENGMNKSKVGGGSGRSSRRGSVMGTKRKGKHRSGSRNGGSRCGNNLHDETRALSINSDGVDGEKIDFEPHNSDKE